MGARLRELYLTGSVLPGIDAAAITLEQDLWLDKARVTGRINIVGADIGGQFSANEAELEDGDHTTLWAQRASIAGSRRARR